MNIDHLLNSMTPEVYESLKTVVETGKWFDGQLATKAQKESSMQAIMLYQARVERSNQHMTIGSDGQVVTKSKRELKQEFSPQSTIARFSEDDF